MKTLDEKFREMKKYIDTHGPTAYGRQVYGRQFDPDVRKAFGYEEEQIIEAEQLVRDLDEKIGTFRYPEHQKLRAIAKESQLIGSFLEDMREKGWNFCQYSEGDLIPDYRPIRAILADYFEIDQDKLEQEKLAMLDESRKANGG